MANKDPTDAKISGLRSFLDLVRRIELTMIPMMLPIALEVIKKYSSNCLCCWFSDILYTT